MNRGRERTDIERFPILYIVGVPRSGTTLLSQVLSRYMPVGYINNLIARFWLCPSTGIRLSKTLLGDDARSRITFVSSCARTEGLEGPHEFGYFWRRWLKLDESPTHHLSKELLSRLDKTGLKKALEREILGVFRAPVVFKNVICGFHAEFLSELHPYSLFIHIKRDPPDVISSILKCRKELFGSYERWWSLKPSTYPFLDTKGDPVAEVTRQVNDCYREIEEEMAAPSVTSMSIHYRDLCRDPSGVIHMVCRRVAEMGTDINPLRCDISEFPYASSSRLPSALEKRLYETCFARL